MRELCWMLGLALLTCACTSSGRRGAERPQARVTTVYPLQADTLGEVDGVTILEGGYSALTFDEQGRLWATTDRGPNLEAQRTAGGPSKRFPIPDYAPAAHRLEFKAESVVVDSVLAHVAGAGGAPASGLPPPPHDPALQVEEALSTVFEQLPNDPSGIDSEGLAFGAGQRFVSEEYRPSIWVYRQGEQGLATRYTPVPTDSVDVLLPTWLLQRQPNLGFEGLAYQGGYLYAALQGPLSTPGADDFTTLVRLLRINVETQQWRTFLYALDGSKRKIGDLAFAPDGRLLVLEHGELVGGGWSANVYALNVDQLDFLDETALAPERFRDVATALTAGFLIASKSHYVDLIDAGWPRHYAKPEGLAVDVSGRLYLINDNDFGLDSPMETGAAVPTNQASKLFVVEDVRSPTPDEE